MLWHPRGAHRLLPGLAVIFGLVGSPGHPGANARVAGGWVETIADPGQVEQDRLSDQRLFEAETYLQEGNPVAAIPILEEILADNPSRVDVWKVLARAYQIWVAATPDAPDELVNAAVAAYRTVLEREPGDRMALEGLRVLSARYAAPVEETLKSGSALESWKTAEDEFRRQMERPAEERDFETAIASYRAAVREEPRHPHMYVRLAEAMEESGIHTVEVRGLYSTALRMDPANVTALNALALMEITAGRLEEAEKLLRIAFELNDQEAPETDRPEARVTRERLGRVIDELGERLPTPERHFYLGRIHLAEEDYAEAVKALKTASDLDTTNLSFRKYLAVAWFERGDMNEALGAFQEILQGDPDDPDALFHIGSVLFDLKHFEPAIQHLMPVAEIPRYRARAARLLGLALTRVDEHGQGAVFYLERALRENAGDPTLACVLGEQYLRLQKWDEARVVFDQCLASSPDHPAGLLGSGLVADHEGRYGEAADRLEKFLEGHPDSPAVLMRLGLSYIRLDQPDSAVARFRSAIVSDSAFSEIKVAELSTSQVLELGFLILMAGRNLADGIVVGEFLANGEPDNAGYANNLAMAYADADTNLERALELAKIANRKTRDNAGFLDTLGWTYVRLGRFKDARKTLDRAIELALAEPDTDASEIYYHMAFLLAEMKRTDEAIEYLNKTLARPGNPLIEESARILLERLQQKSDSY